MPSQESLALESLPGTPVDDAEQTQQRRRESRTRVLVLIGSALSQLPIWGFAISYGIFQEYYSSADWTLSGSKSPTGVIGTTSNGVMYLSMPPLFALLTLRYARHRRRVALAGTAIACFAFLMSSLSTAVWHLVATQGVLAAFGCALVYSPMTLSLGEWFSGRNRAVAYASVLAAKNVFGSACPFIFRVLLDNFGFRNTLRIWTGITAVTSVLAVWMVPTHPSRTTAPPGTEHRSRDIPWHFLRHSSIYVHGFATMLQSAGYGIPQTYLNTYAHDAAKLSQTTATLLLTLFNVPGIASSAFFGYVADNKYFTISASAATALSGFSSALSALLLWGLTSQGSMALLVLFSITFGFFAGGYSATWGGVIDEMESEAAGRNEAIDTGLVYGMLNGARGLGYVAGGLAGVPLLEAGGSWDGGRFGYGTAYGPLILFTGLSTVFGGGGLLWKGIKCLARVPCHSARLERT